MLKRSSSPFGGEFYIKKGPCSPRLMRILKGGVGEVGVQGFWMKGFFGCRM